MDNNGNDTSGVGFASSNKLNNKINKFFQNFNVAYNTNSEELSSSNLGVNFLGNSGAIRINIQDANPIHRELPSFSSGCSGIDFALS